MNPMAATRSFADNVGSSTCELRERRLQRTEGCSLLCGRAPRRPHSHSRKCHHRLPSGHCALHEPGLAPARRFYSTLCHDRAGACNYKCLRTTASQAVTARTTRSTIHTTPATAGVCYWTWPTTPEGSCLHACSTYRASRTSRSATAAGHSRAVAARSAERVLPHRPLRGVVVCTLREVPSLQQDAPR